MMTDFTNINEMPEWPKQMACDKANARSGGKIWEPSEVGKCRRSTLTELAIMCWQFCEEPVDPDLLIAREAMAQWSEQTSGPKVAAEYRNGDCDEPLKGGPAHIAARLAREQGAK